MSNKLLENFYTEIASSYTAENNSTFNCQIELNPEHEIYKGHFPQTPVAPGVCVTQIIKEILMDKFQKNLILTEANNIKFLILINPKETKEFKIDFTVKQINNGLDVNANYINKDKIFLKFKGKFTIA
jgi:3-hydroxyacyl-[acyl-carrier-protein] dehydratase